VRIDAQDLGTLLEVEARRMVGFAHDPEHYLHPDRGESPDRTYPAHLVTRLKLPNWETQVKFCYSVDVRDGRGVRHLSVQVSVPGYLTQGEVTGAAPQLLQLLDDPVRMFFPLAEGIRYQITALAPIPVVDARQDPRNRNVHHRTPVVFHFLVDHGVVDEDAARALPTAKRRAVRLVHAALAAAAREVAGDGEVRDYVNEIARDLYDRHAAAFLGETEA